MIMKYKEKPFLTLVFGLIIYGLLFYFLYRKSDIASWCALWHQTKPALLALSLVFGAGLILSQGFYLKKIFELFGAPISLKEATILWLATVPLGVISLGLGGAVLIYNKARQYKLSSFLAAVATLLHYVFHAFTNLILLVFSAFFGQFYSRHSFPYLNTILLAMTLIIVCIALLALHRRARSRMLSLIFKWFSVLPTDRPTKLLSLKIVSSSKGLAVLLASFLTSLTNLIIFQLVLLSYGVKMHPVVLLQNYVMSEVLAIFSPSGGGVGVVEVGLVGFLKASGLNFTQAGLVTFTFRLINFWLAAIVGYFVLLSFGIQIFSQQSRQQTIQSQE